MIRQWSELSRSTESLIIFMGAPAPGAPVLPTPLHHDKSNIYDLIQPAILCMRRK